VRAPCEKLKKKTSKEKRKRMRHKKNNLGESPIKLSTTQTHAREVFHLSRDGAFHSANSISLDSVKSCSTRKARRRESESTTREEFFCRKICWEKEREGFITQSRDRIL